MVGLLCAPEVGLLCAPRKDAQTVYKKLVSVAIYSSTDANTQCLILNYGS